MSRPTVEEVQRRCDDAKNRLDNDKAARDVLVKVIGYVDGLSENEKKASELWLASLNPWLNQQLHKAEVRVKNDTLHHERADYHLKLVKAHGHRESPREIWMLHTVFVSVCLSVRLRARHIQVRRPSMSARMCRA